MKIRFELDAPIGVPISRSQILELCKEHKVPFILLFSNVTDPNPLPKDWYDHGEIFFRSTKEQVESLENILSKNGSCEILELQETRFVSRKTNG